MTVYQAEKLYLRATENAEKRLQNYYDREEQRRMYYQQQKQANYNLRQRIVRGPFQSPLNNGPLQADGWERLQELSDVRDGRLRY